MVWCPHCAQHSDTHYDYSTGSVCCVECGKVITQDNFTEETDFVKDSAGHAHASGNIVRSAHSSTESLERTLNKGNVVIYELIDKYGIGQVNHATNYYRIAVERGFTRGRRTNQVAAACLYVACREQEKPFLLIEFSSELGVSVYELGTVYLQLCKLLSLQDHPFIQKPVDPSLFMHRYTSGLVKDGNIKKVSTTALQLVVSMKRDWIQTGRKPSGICAAAIYVSSVLHGYNFTKADVVKAVHICEATLTKRLIEFENTEAGSLTIEEFTQNALDYENEMQSCKQTANDLKMPGITEVVCQHKSSASQSGFGLCKDCYMEFCGGLYGSEPPAFQRAEIERFSKESVKRLTESTPQNEDHNENGAQNNKKEMDNICSSTEVKHVAPNSEKPDKTSDDVDDFECSKEASVDETHTLDDIDDCEVIGYLLDEKESLLKKTIWEKLDGNIEYMQEQAAKEAAAAAKRKLYTGTSEEIREAQAIAAAAAQEVANRKQREKRKRELEAKNAKPAQTAAEAASQHFNKKKLSNKINQDALNSIFGDEEPNPEKSQVGDSSNKKVEEMVNEDDNNNNNDEEDDDEWNYDNERMNGGYGDGDYDDGDDGYEGF